MGLLEGRGFFFRKQLWDVPCWRGDFVKGGDFIKTSRYRVFASDIPENRAIVSSGTKVKLNSSELALKFYTNM